MQDDIVDIPTQQVRKYLRDWKDALERYKRYKNTSAVRDANKIITELEVELEARKSMPVRWFTCITCENPLCDLCAECHCKDCERAMQECEE